MCVLILLYIYDYMCVLTLLRICYYMCVRKLLYVCPHRFRQRRCDGGTRFRWSRLAGRRMWYSYVLGVSLYTCALVKQVSQAAAGVVWQKEGCGIHCVICVVLLYVSAYFYICVLMLPYDEG